MRDPRVAILYLGDRRVAYSSLAFHIMKGYLEEMRVPHHTYFYENGMIISENPAPHPSKTTVLLVSLPYEILYVDLVKALIWMGLNPWRGRRREGPLIIAGGPSVTANPLPVYDIVDALLIGEIEPVFNDILNSIYQKTGRNILGEIANIPGFLVPGLKDETTRVYARDLDKTWYPVRQEPPGNIEPVWGKSFILETTRGCARMCRFCMEGVIFRPKRDRSYERLRGLLDRGIEETRTSKVAFYSLAFFDSPHAESILSYAVSKGLEVSVPSIRPETLTVERARLISRGGQRTITIAPETGSCRIGRAINKCIGKEGALNAIQRAIDGGVRNVKLYLIIGFPGETSLDVNETVELVVRAARLIARMGGTLKVTVNPFIPKPATPMQWAPAPSLNYVRRTIAMIMREVRRNGGRASTYDPKWAIIQTVLARGDRRISSLLVEWAAMRGRLGSFRKAVERARINIEEYLGSKPLEWTPPWHEHVSHPYASLKHLKTEYKLFLREIENR